MELGAVGIGFLVAAAFALAISCMGPNPMAKAAAATLFAGCLLSNLFQDVMPLQSAVLGFILMNLVFAAAFTPLLIFRWSIWLGLILAANYTQILFHLDFNLNPDSFQTGWSNALIDNVLYGLQLAAVTAPTFTPRRRRAPQDRVQRRRAQRVQTHPRRGPVQLRLVDKAA